MTTPAGRLHADARLSRLVGLAAAVVAPVWLVAAVFNLERVGRAFDSIWARASVDRVIRLDGGYYTAGSDHRGPFWMAIYHVTELVTPRWAFWFAVAVLIVVVAAGTALAVVVVARTVTGERAVTAAAGVFVLAYLVFGPEEYSRVLYSRNVTTALTALAFALVCRLPRDRLRPALLVGSGVAAGLAVQTITTSALPCAVVGLVAVLSTVRMDGRRSLRVTLQAAAWWAVPMLVTVAAAPVYYALRGEFGDFWAHYVTYNRHYTAATGRSTLEILRKSLADIGWYYGRHPFQAALLVAFAVDTVAVWRSATYHDRLLRGGLIGWWFAETISMGLAQRFFEHYRVVPFVPVATMGAILAGRSARIMPPQGRRLAPLGALAAVPFVLGGPNLARGITEALAFRGPARHVERWERSLRPERRFERAVVHALSDSDEYVLYWLGDPFPYDAIDRLSASRYLESRWMTGEIYGGATDARYVLPGTWDRWTADVERARPPIALVYHDRPYPAGTPVDRLLREQYVEVVATPAATVYLSSSRLGSGGRAPCRSIRLGTPTAAPVDVRFEGRHEGGVLLSESDVVSETPKGPLATVPRPGPGGGELRVDVYERSAVVWMGPRIVGAVPLTSTRQVRVRSSEGMRTFAVRCTTS